MGVNCFFGAVKRLAFAVRQRALRRGCWIHQPVYRDNALVHQARSGFLFEETQLARDVVSTRALICGARSAVIQSRRLGANSSVMRALVSMPRSPTRHTRYSPCDLQPGDLAGWPASRLCGVAVEDSLYRYRYPGGRTQQPVDDLQPAFDPVAGVPALLPQRQAGFKPRAPAGTRGDRAPGCRGPPQNVVGAPSVLFIVRALCEPARRSISYNREFPLPPSLVPPPRHIAWRSELAAVSARSRRHLGSSEPGLHHPGHQASLLPDHAAAHAFPRRSDLFNTRVLGRRPQTQARSRAGSASAYRVTSANSSDLR